MTPPNREGLEKFIHGINSKSGALKDAAPLLRDVTPEEFNKLLELMRQQAESMLRLITDFRSSRSR